MPARPLLRLAVALTLAATGFAPAAATLAPATAHAAPVALGKSDVPGLKKRSASAGTLRSTLTGAMRGGPRGAVRTAPAAASAYALPGGGRLLTGSIELRNQGTAKAVARATRKRTSVGKRASSAVVSVRAGELVGLVTVQLKGRDKTVSKTAALYAEALRTRLVANAGITVAERLEDDGDPSKAEALALFQLAYGGMPGARVPTGTRGTVSDGFTALGRVRAILPSLRPAQVAAFNRAVTGSATIVGARAAASATTPGRPQASAARAPKPSTGAPDPAAQALADGFVGMYRDGRLGNVADPLVRTYHALPGLKATADSLPLDAAGKIATIDSGGFDHCRIRLGAKYYAQSAVGQRFAIAHEVFHCISFRITDDWGPGRDWVIEGLANWAAAQVTGASTDSLGYRSFERWWLQDPGKPLFKIAYSANGFWGHQNQILHDVWARVIPVLQGGSDEATFDAAGGMNDEALASYASSLLRRSGAPPAWILTDPYAVPESKIKTPRGVTAAAVATLATPPHTSQLTDVQATAKTPVIELRRASGHVRSTDGTTDYTDDAVRYFCLSGPCECPPGERPENLPFPLSNVSELTVALAGDRAGGLATIRRHAMKEYCKKDDTDQGKPSGPGGSNGDPHLSTLDGLRYDFQAAGEFVLAKGGDLEIQARQEPWAKQKSVTINTQFGIRIGGQRVTITAGEPLLVKVNGKPVTIPVDGGMSVGNGHLDTNFGEVNLRWPDGTTAYAFPVGSYGAAISLTLAGGRANKVSGLLGDFDGDPNDDLRPRSGGAPMKFDAGPSDWPGLARIKPLKADSKAFADALYDRFGESWRIKESASLMDYGKGESTATFTDRAIPKRVLDPSDFSATRRANAEAICRAAGITAAGPLADCILDVAATGEAAFATAAAKEQELLVPLAWTQLAAGADRTGPMSIARTGDGTMHLVYRDGRGDAAHIVHTAVNAAGAESGTVEVLPFDTTPFVFPSSSGGLGVVGAVIDAGPPIVEGIVQSGAGADGGGWSAGPMVTSGGSYVGEPSVAYAADGTQFTVNPGAGNSRLFRGSETKGIPLSGVESGDDCYETQPAIATSGGQTFVAWHQWDCGAVGLYVAQVDPTSGNLGPATLVPQSVFDEGGPSAWDSSGLERLSMVARPGGGLYLAFARKDGSTWSSLLWRLGDPAPATVASGLRDEPRGLQVSAEPTTGRLWVAWQSRVLGTGAERLSVRASDPAGAFSGPVRTIAWPGPAERPLAAHAWDVVARDGALDLFAGLTNDGNGTGTIWHSVLPN